MGVQRLGLKVSGNCADSRHDERFNAPLRNFFGNDVLTLLYLNQDPPHRLVSLREDLLIASNQKTKKGARAGAALRIGRILAGQAPGELTGVGGDGNLAADWFRLAASLNSVSAAFWLGAEAAERSKLEVLYDAPSVLPRLQPMHDTLSGPSAGRELHAPESAAQWWYRGVRLALRHIQQDFACWELDEFTDANRCIINWLVLWPAVPRHASSDLRRQERLAALRTWVWPLWKRLAHVYEERGYSRMALSESPSIQEQQQAVWLMLQDGEEADHCHVLRGQERRTLTADKNSIVVIPGEIAPTTDKFDSEALALYQPLRRAIPLVTLPDMARLIEIRAELLAIFPWASAVVAEVMDDLMVRRSYGARTLGMRPTLLVGGPGVGKTHFAYRFAELLGLPNTVIALAGMSDAKMFKGQTRGWASARASRVVEFVRQNRIGNPLFIIDEVDKVGVRVGDGGHPHDAMLDLLEPGNATRYSDIYLLAECNLSKCLYIGTANSLTGLSDQFLSRWRLIHFPAPGPEHSDMLVRSCVLNLEREWGLPIGTLDLSSMNVNKLSGLGAREIMQALPALLADQLREVPRQLQ